MNEEEANEDQLLSERLVKLTRPGGWSGREGRRSPSGTSALFDEDKHVVENPLGSRSRGWWLTEQGTDRVPEESTFKVYAWEEFPNFSLSLLSLTIHSGRNSEGEEEVRRRRFPPLTAFQGAST